MMVLKTWAVTTRMTNSIRRFVWLLPEYPEKTKREAIVDAVSKYNLYYGKNNTWDDMRKEGFRCVRATLTVKEM
jgi:hypothetical protein